MLALTVLCFSFLFSVVFSIPLSERDVINPHITNPHDGTVWMVGSKETVTWDTSDFPPDSQITNPNGRVILGHLENDSLNLQLEHPLAQGFKLRAGKVTITVPDVPDRDDYIIVLMGDSGNASPSFVITSISKGSSTIRAATSSSLITGPIPITGTTITGGQSPTVVSSQASTDTSASTTASEPATTASGPATTATAPVSSVSSIGSSLPQSQTVTQGGTAAPASTSASAAWSVHNIKLCSIITAPLAVVLLL